MNIGLAHSIVPVKPIDLKIEAKACQKHLQVLKTTSPKRMDAGLRQLNIGYFGQQVKASCQSLESYTHLDIAVNLLKQHYKSSKNWLMVLLSSGRW